MLFIAEVGIIYDHRLGGYYFTHYVKKVVQLIYIDADEVLLVDGLSSACFPVLSGCLIFTALRLIAAVVVNCCFLFFAFKGYDAEALYKKSFLEYFLDFVGFSPVLT
jgi:hypothetical protein